VAVVDAEPFRLRLADGALAAVFGDEALIVGVIDSVVPKTLLLSLCQSISRLVCQPFALVLAQLVPVFLDPSPLVLSALCFCLW
jgi:hypothetical protein